MAQVVDPELSEHILEGIVNGALVGVLNHVGAQVNPLLEVLLDHLEYHLLSISLGGVYVDEEVCPREQLILQREWESVVLVVG